VFLALTISVIDAALPEVFYFITQIERARDWDSLHDSTLVKLFITRLLVSTVFTSMNADVRNNNIDSDDNDDDDE
jgi:hypothetical protein